MEFISPVYKVLRVPVDKIKPNGYNPNKVATIEFKLLYESIKADGYTLPIVCYYEKENDTYTIVDGFHRYSILLKHKDIYKREGGCLPVVVIEKDIENRIASTIRHNRARGVHSIDIMANIVASLLKNKSEKWIVKNLGMCAEEVLRLKNNGSFLDKFQNKDFSSAWEIDN